MDPKEKKAQAKQQKIMALWTRAYDDIFSDPRLEQITSFKMLEYVKKEALALQKQEVEENYHEYSGLPLVQIERMICDAVTHEGYDIAKTLIHDLLDSIDESECFKA